MEIEIAKSKRERDKKAEDFAEKWKKSKGEEDEEW